MPQVDIGVRPQIARFMGHTGPIWGQQDPGWPHEPCYEGGDLEESGVIGTTSGTSEQFITTFSPRNISDIDRSDNNANDDE